ncbi:MAG: hypothetical protein HWN66_10330 [Candidatus Helarchaeota archaeon]|nr:hypothetical protein [Candidatus Helarchaeota archaeon]
MPIFRKRRTIWQIKEMEGYLNKVLESQIPPDYDVKPYSPEHQALDAIIRSNWESLHPCEQDFIYSWFIELQTAEDQKKDLQIRLKDINKELTTIQEESTSKIEELNKKLSNINSELLNSKNALNQKVEFVKELTNAIQNKQMGEDQLQERMKERIKNMEDRMIKQQEKFEVSQIKIGNQFKTKVMELDEEKLLLNEKIEKNREHLTQLEKENQDLGKRNLLLKIFQDKLIAIKSIIESTPSNKLIKGGN